MLHILMDNHYGKDGQAGHKYDIQFFMNNILISAIICVMVSMICLSIIYYLINLENKAEKVRELL